jgi:hypothetical protein
MILTDTFNALVIHMHVLYFSLSMVTVIRHWLLVGGTLLLGALPQSSILVRFDMWGPAPLLGSGFHVESDMRS